MANFTEEGTSKFAQAGDLKMHYHEAGEGETVVMLHGGGPGTTAWANFAGNIDAMAAKYHVLLVDQPGFGKSDKPHYKGGLGAFNAKAVHGLLDTLGIKKAHLVGNSMGGMTSLMMALQNPDRIDRMVLMGPGGSPTVMYPEISEGIKVLATFYAPPGPSVERMRNFISVMTYDSSHVTDAELQARVDRAMQPDIADWYKTMMFNKDGASLDEIWRDFEKIKQKTLLIWGRDDRTIPLDRSLFMLQRMPDVNLFVMGKCGHWAMIEHAEKFNRMVVDFLSDPNA